MIDLDLKDRKILYQLDLNARQSLTQIGKKVNLPKNVVYYRIKYLEEQNIIRRYYTIIDTFKLGYNSFRLYFTYQYTDQTIQNEIIDYFVQNNYTYWIASTEGQFNLVVITWVKDPCSFYSLWQNCMKKYRDFFQEKDFSFYFQLLHFHNSYLINDFNKMDREKCEIIGCGESVYVDELDLRILRIIAENARIPIVSIAQKTHSTVPTVNVRLKRLINSGVIQGFRTEFDLAKLGYQQFKVDIILKEYNKINAITSYLRENPSLFYITKTAGRSDLEPTFRVRDTHQIHEIMHNLNRKFPGTIKNYSYFYVTKQHKLDYMPKYY